MIKVKLLHPEAQVPSVNYSGQDLGFDLYAIEDVRLEPGIPVKVRTGIAVEGPSGMGFVLGDRSSMAAKGITYAGGRIDAGYRGEILVCLINVNQPQYTLSLERGSAGQIEDARLVRSDVSVMLHAGDKIVQMSPFQAMTHFELVVVEELGQTSRAAQGFGSSGR
ncbi:dUTP diphosphatase [Acidipila sp. EB88]|uniref:dUTP diphosphatase n=1 Tax=Acidipila sp. EB88 TaxID=2305226 RepID=UPI000F5E67C1|nr:dUTP diphosphatase [Acidipila sp. EB88]RRA47433.1 dUTP diphosphatase [Acidipila sp. EB88]